MGKRKAASSTSTPISSGETGRDDRVAGDMIEKTDSSGAPSSTQSPQDPPSRKPGQTGSRLSTLPPAHRMKSSIEGVKELLSLLEQVEPESGVTFLFAQHLDQKHDRKLRKLLAGLRHRPVTPPDASLRAELRNTARELKTKTSELSDLHDELAGILNALQIPIVVVARDLRIRYATNAARTLLSKRFADSERRITETMLALHIPDLKSRILQVIEASCGLTHEFQDEDGRWNVLTMQPLLTAQKAVDAVVIKVVDIDAQRNTELNLRSQQQVTRGLFDTVGGILVMIGKHQQVELINRKGSQLLGYSEQEVIGRDWFDTFVPEATRKDERELFAHLLAGKPNVPDDIETPIVTSGGDQKLILWSRSIITDESGTAAGMLCSGHDITAWRKAEVARQESEEQLRLILAMERGDEFFIVDPHGNILSWMAGTTLGRRMRGDNVVGKHISSFYPAEDFVAGRPMRALTLADTEGRYEERGWWLDNDGSQHRAITIVTPIRNADGTLRGFSSIVHYLDEEA